MLLQTLTNRVSKGSKKVSLRLVLIVPLVLQIFAAVGLTGWLSLQNGQKAVNDLASQLQVEVSTRIVQHLDRYLAIPHQINQINSDAIELGLLNPANVESMEKYFWKQMQVFDVGYISFGNKQGEFIGVERLDNNNLLINEVSQKSGLGKLYIYGTDNEGNRLNRIAIKNWNPLVEPWYTDLMKAGKPLWSQIYHWTDKPEILSISASYPVYNQTHQIIGILSVDLILSQINDFLDSLKVSQSGKTFILENNGLLVASSSKEQPLPLNQGKTQRIQASTSKNPVIRLTAQNLTKRFSNLQDIQDPQQFNFKIEGARHYVQVTPFSDEFGLDWLIVVVVPEADFMGQINANTRTTIALCIGALVVATVIAIFTSTWITRPILQLSAASRAIASGQLDQNFEGEGIQELGMLAESFNQMAHQLRSYFNALEKTNEKLEQRVEQRTAALRLSEEKFALAFRSSPDPITITTLSDGRFIEVNDSFLNITGYGRDDVIDRTTMELNCWVNSDDQVRLHLMLTDEGAIRNQEFDFRIKSGEIRTGLFSAEIINIGGQDCLLSVINDITVRKQAQEALSESQRTLSTLMSNLPGMAYRACNDLNWTMKFVSEGCCDLTGYQPEDLINNSKVSFQKLILLEDRELVQGEVQAAIAERRPFRIVYRIITATGEQKWVWEQGRGVFSPDGELLTIEGFITDITERKKATEALQQKEQYLRLILDNIPQQVFWKDTNLIFLGCNKNWAEATGVDSPEAVVGLTDYDLLPNREIADFYREQDRKIIETNTPQLHVIASKAKPSPDGKTIWLDMSKIPIHDSKGNVVGILGVLEDITQRKYAEEALRAEQENSERLLLNIFPQAIAAQLKQNQSGLVKQNGGALIAEQFEEVTILFADIVGFTPLSTRMPPKQLVNLLGAIISAFDQLSEQHGLEKIKTIGDAYMVAGGLPLPRADHAEAIAKMALDMQQIITQFRTDKGEPFQIRIGINTGSVVAGVIGMKKFIYDLWGDTVNVASRMESQGIAGGIQVTAATYERLQNKYILEKRGAIFVKGKGEMVTYWLTGKKY
ncbi:MAG TPA: hypothetical protein DD379_06500 [Cyanobacteria bacterium UBA11162]|nr:hypothetical protein [Cyanobacteria bacterium UBA11162]